jgi:hypothetical protein
MNKENLEKLEQRCRDCMIRCESIKEVMNCESCYLRQQIRDIQCEGGD